MSNPNCDMGHCTEEHGKVRVLPHTSDPHHGNDILCRHCFGEALAYRRSRNRQLSKEARYPLPEWESLEVYDPAAWDAAYQESRKKAGIR